jgi:hypothetical protein
VAQWECFAHNGHTFAIIEAFNGGGPNTALADDIANARKAGLNHTYL